MLGESVSHRGDCMGRTKNELRTLLDDLAQRITDCDDDELRTALDRETRELAISAGEWVYDALNDRLTGDGDTYSQDLQDWYRTTRACFISRTQSAANLPVSLMGDDPEMLDSLRMSMGVLEILGSILPADFRRLRRDAKLSQIEYDCFYYWLRSYTPKQMAQWMVQRDGTPYKYRSIVAILRRTWHKIQYCPYVAWRTCLAEDIARGRNWHRPNYMGWSDVIEAEPGLLPEDSRIPGN